MQRTTIAKEKALASMDDENKRAGVIDKWIVCALDRRNFSFLEQIRQLEGNLQDCKILNLGCGRFTFNRYFEEYSAELVGADINTCTLSQAKESGSDFLVANDAFNLPFRDEVFDVVFCVGLFHHFSDIRKIVAEMLRCLKKGGLIYCVEPNAKFLPSAIVEFLGKNGFKNIRELLHGILPNYIPPEQYEHALTKAQIEKIFYACHITNLHFTYYTEPHFCCSKSLAIIQIALFRLFKKMLNEKFRAFEFRFYSVT